MPQIKLSRRARNDLPRLYRFLAQWDEAIASEGIDTILRAFELISWPESGTPVPDRKGLRKLLIDLGSSGYTALYRFSKKTDTIVVLAIKHQKEKDYTES